jgi:hypothetical protein
MLSRIRQFPPDTLCIHLRTSCIYLRIRILLHSHLFPFLQYLILLILLVILLFYLLPASYLFYIYGRKNIFHFLVIYHRIYFSFPPFFMSSTTWLNHLVLGRNIDLLLIYINSDTHLDVPMFYAFNRHVNLEAKFEIPTWTSGAFLIGF